MAKKKSEKQLYELAEYDWLKLGDIHEVSVDNPLFEKTQEDIEQPHLHLLKLILNPDYFGFTCKHLLNLTVAPFQLAILRELWFRPFPMLIGVRGGSKSFCLGLYAVLRALLCQGSRVVIIGSAFRQAKGVFEYAERIWNNAPVLRDLVGPGSRKNSNGPHRETDRWYLKIGESYIIALPMGTGEKLRGTRATHLLVDEFASINPEIFEVVIRGFGSVSMDPVERMKTISRFKKMKELRLIRPESDLTLSSNQTVFAGTAYYSFNHFYKYWSRYKAIIESRGDRKKVEEIFAGEVPEKFDYRDYSVIRIPVELIPEGFMDEKTIASAKATMHQTNYRLEYSAIFANDSNGFFKRSLVESCVVGKSQNPIHHEGGLVYFTSQLRGVRGRTYVMGVDPASEADNFAIVIIEVWPDHRRIVHCWTTNRSAHQERASKGLSKENDFYYYAANKIRQLHHDFPCKVIAIDAQGGGITIMEALKNDKSLTSEQRLAGMTAILPIVDYDDPKPTDDVPGEHIISVIQFARADWVAEANHGMRADFETRKLLFPDFDSASLGVAITESQMQGVELYDGLENCMMEIEELKDELATIVHTQTGISGRDRWDTPEVKMPGNKKGRLRKDRYSALLMANAEARQIGQELPLPEYGSSGGFVKNLKSSPKDGPIYAGPGWFTEQLHGLYGLGVKRR